MATRAWTAHSPDARGHRPKVRERCTARACRCAKAALAIPTSETAVVVDDVVDGLGMDHALSDHQVRPRSYVVREHEERLLPPSLRCGRGRDERQQRGDGCDECGDK